MDTSAIPENPKWETSNKVRKAMMVYDDDDDDYYTPPNMNPAEAEEDEDELRERLKRERQQEEQFKREQRLREKKKREEEQQREEERRKKREEAYLETQRKRREEQQSPLAIGLKNLASNPRYRRLNKLLEKVLSIDRIKTDYLNQERSADRQELEDLKRVRTQLADLAQQYEEELPSDINDYIADRYVELNNYIERSFSIRLSKGRRMV